MEQEVKNIDVLYQEIIESTKNYFSNIGLASTPVGIFTFLYQMLSSGIFTNHPELINVYPLPQNFLKMEEQYFDLSMSGKLVPFGYQLCRHTCNFAHEIYKCLGYQSSQLFVYQMELDVEILGEEISRDVEQQIMNELHQELLRQNPTTLTDIVLQLDGYAVRFSYEECGEGKATLGNHTINIVLNPEGKIHLFDFTSLLIGEKTKDRDILNMYDAGRIYTPVYVKESMNYDRASTSNEFTKALTLLRCYPSVSHKESLREASYFLKEYDRREKELQLFHDKNSRAYDQLTEEVKQLIKTVQ